MAGGAGRRWTVAGTTGLTAVSRGQYWETMVEGNRNGRYVKAICRFHASGNRAELYFASGY